MEKKESGGDDDVVEVSAEQLLEWAVGQHRAGNFPEAGSGYLKILEAYPSHPGALNFLGVLRHQMGESEHGIELVRAAVESAPDYADAWNNLGNILWTLERREEAADAYGKVIELDPAHAGALNNLGIVKKDARLFDDAEKLYRRAIESDPKHTGAHRNLGNLLAAVGREEEGLTMLRRAIELNPRDAREYETLGLAYRRSGNLEAAIALYREWLSFDPDSETAKHHLAACTGDEVPDRASSGYVTEQFDKFAESFDEVLAMLDYRAPELCCTALAAEIPDPDGSLTVLDAGCGTGLCAEGLKPFAKRLVGVDLSGRMLGRALALGLYDDLAKVDLTDFFRTASGFHVAVAADTLCYFGEIDELLNHAASAIRPDGIFIFTVEAADEDGPDYELQPHGRYRHRESYVRATLAAAGFTVTGIAREVIRKERDEHVDGYVVTSRLKAPE